MTPRVKSLGYFRCLTLPPSLVKTRLPWEIFVLLLVLVVLIFQCGCLEAFFSCVNPSRVSLFCFLFRLIFGTNFLW